MSYIKDLLKRLQNPYGAHEGHPREDDHSYFTALCGEAAGAIGALGFSSLSAGTPPAPPSVDTDDLAHQRQMDARDAAIARKLMAKATLSKDAMGDVRLNFTLKPDPWDVRGAPKVMTLGFLRELIEGAK